ncbi:PIN domain-containing protein [Streptomyces sp. Ag109_O5-1]|uniref:PIN domain-containing protein n=1 Tax=Streptomyces sp. Ag109_O5-1 TaxID=1938851 RepID=UPI000FAE0397|nr:PIN domain-containing protein [Streptomyces sp. Ag109_O5-1]RPE39004.1 PIN domain-containing protein [Streptomyces sp. Ag109_O5-1]
MIILDACILRSFSPESSSADLLRAIRTLDAEQVAVPWMVLEELAAQQAIKYRDKFDKAAQAVEALQQVSPWPLKASLGECALADVRAHWRSKWRTVVSEVPTSEVALREAAFREANTLAPCKTVKDVKTGARDAAIWLSAVEYAREHPDETVYFVSANTNDFGSGAPYPSPMSEDIAGLDGRFVHLTSMDEVAARFAEPTTVDEEYAVGILGSPMFRDEVARVSRETLTLPVDGSFSCTVATGLAGERVIVPALGWQTHQVALGGVNNIQTYHIGDHAWCTAIVRWNLGGAVLTSARPELTAWGACSWTTSVLFTPRGAESLLTVLRGETPLPLAEEAFDELKLPLSGSTPLEQSLLAALRSTVLNVNMPRFQEVVRPAESAELRRALIRQLQRNDHSEG